MCKRNVLLKAISCLFLSSPFQLAFAGEVLFQKNCQIRGEKITISAVGDVLLHGPLQKQGFSSQERFQSLWKKMIPIFNAHDLSYANFEGPAADGVTLSGQRTTVEFKYNPQVYTGYPRFNYHSQLMKDLKFSGIDIVSTANNHALDRGSAGIQMTIDAALENDMKFMGTRDEKFNQWYTVTEHRGYPIAWVACTFSTNGIPDKRNQVLKCYEDKQTLLQTVSGLSKKYPAVIVTPHWGNEYEHNPRAQEKNLAKELIDAGALIVFGTHPHVIQPWEQYSSSKSDQEGLIVYSTGNFVSGQFQKTATQVGMLISTSLVFDSSDNKFKLIGARHLPLLMKSSPYRIEPQFNDSGANPAFSQIWTKIYPNSQRLTSLQDIQKTDCD